MNNWRIYNTNKCEWKKWISITGLCNNNCLFCLDGNRSDKFHKDKDKIIGMIIDAKKKGYTKLVLSGGDPTINPNLINFVRLAKRLKFSKIQVITNGRMFSNKEFTQKIISAGLDEVTFSIHGHTQEIHDYLTRVNGSFDQLIKGIKNVQELKKEVVINTDTCVTEKNYMYLVEIVEFIVSSLKINEINLMSLVPEGNSWKNKDSIMCSFDVVSPYIKKVIDLSLKKKVVLWLSRFPEEYLEGYESFIEDPCKRVDDVEARIDFLKDTINPSCRGDKCFYCILNKLCHKFVKINSVRSSEKSNQKKRFDTEVVLKRNNYKNLKDLVSSHKTNLLKFHPPTKNVEDYKNLIPGMYELVEYLKEIDEKNVYIEGVPICILNKGGIKNINHISDESIDYSNYIKSGIKDYFGLARDLALNVKTKRLVCKECLYFERCEGVYLNYIRIFGFKELVPCTRR